MTHYTKKRIETVSNSFRKNALSVAISALSTTIAGVRDGLKGGVYVTLIAGQVVAPVVWAANLPELAGPQTSVTIENGASIDGIATGKSDVYTVTGARVLANWTSFDIAEGYGIEFLQGDPSNILVNQITGSASEIAGLLKANGNIILVNPNGMTIAGTAIIDVNSLVVSGMGLSGGVDAGNQDFFQGNDETENYNNLLLVKTDANGKITIESGVDFTNDAEGIAHTRNNNFIAVGAEVDNAANITVGNLLGLGAGGAGYISFNQDGLVGFEITADVTDAVGTNAISSIGELSAQQVFLTARDASDLYNSAINLEGTAKAASINIDGDTIRLGGEVDLSNGTDTLNIHNNGAATELTIGNSASIDFGTDGQAMADASKVTIENGNTTLNNAQLTGADNEITLGTTDFSVTSVNNLNLADGALEGSVGADTFDMTGASLTANGIAVSGVQNNQVDANGGADVFTGAANGWSLTGTANELTDSIDETYTFTGVTDANLSDQALTGSAGADTFDMTGASLTANGIAVSGVQNNQVNANGGADVFTGAANGWSLTGTANELTDSIDETYTFTGVTDANLSGQALTGSGSADTFNVTGGTLTANSINITGSTNTINAGGGADVFSGTTSGWLLTSNLNELTDNIFTFADVTGADLSGESLTGTMGTDTFDMTGASLTANGIAVSGVQNNQVNANGGADVFTGAANGWSLTGTANELTDSIDETYTFTGVTDANLSDQALTGSAGADTFDMTGASLTANGIAVSGVQNNQVNANGGADVFTGAANGWSLTGTANELIDSIDETYTFTGVTDANLSGQALTGSGSADTFNVTGGTLTANSINITGSTNTINAGGGADVFSGTTSGWLLTSNLNELTDNIFTFADVTGADLSGESLTGTMGTDTFDMTGASLTANGIAVSGVQNNQVNANGGADVFTGAANGWSLTGTANELTDSIDETYTFTGVTDANLSDQALTGSAGADTFDMTGASLTANGIAVSGVQNNQVNANGGADVFTGAANGWSLTGTANELIDSIDETYTFTGVTDANLSGQALTGSDSADTFDMTGASLTANGIAVSGVQNNQVNANGGADVFTGAENGWSLTGIANELTDSIDQTYTFTGVTDANLSGQALTGSGSADTFNVTGGTLTANSINITGSTNTINAGGGADVFSGTTSGWLLTSNLNELTDNIFTFTDVTGADLSGESLTGTTGTDTFDMTGASLTANGIAVSGVQNNQVNANGGADVFTGAANGWSLTGTANELIDSIDETYTFTGVTDANLSGQALTGSDSADTFDMTGASLTANGIAVSGVQNNQVNANGGADVFTGAENGWSLTGIANELTDSIDQTYTFTGVTDANLSGQALTGSGSADTFNVTGGTLTANSINITGSTNTINAGGGADVFSGTTSGWLLTSNLNELTDNIFTFTDVTGADLSGESLTGTMGTDTFDMTGASLTANGIAVSGVQNNQVNANGGADVFTGAANGWSLTGTANELTDSIDETYTFTGVTDANLSDQALTGSAGADTFDMTGASLTANGIAVSGVQNNQVNANGGADVFTGAANGWSLTGIANELTDSIDQTYTFTGVTDANLSGQALTGSGSADTFNVTGGTLTANSINITGSTNTINAGGGADVFSGTTSGWLLTSNLNELTDNIFTFTDVTGADLSGESLTGTTGTDTFDMTGVSLTANGIAVSGVQNNQVNANGGADVFTGAANGWSLTGTANELTDSIDETYTFTGVTDANLSGQALTGSDSADTFDMTGASLTANGIAVSGVQNNQVNANGGADVFTGAANGWSLTGIANELTDSIDQTYTFTGVTDANLSGQALTGSGSADTFNVTGGTLTANSINITGSTNTINAGGGADVFSGTTSGWLLTSNLNELTDNIFTFTDVTGADLSGESLTGTTGTDTFDMTGVSLTANGIAVSGVQNNQVNANGGADVFTGAANGWSLTGTANELTDSIDETYTFTGVTDANLSGQALTGSDSADTFDMTGASLTANGIAVSGVQNNQVNANGGADVFTGAANGWSLTGIANELTDSIDQTYTFTGVTDANLSGQALTGSGSADTFNVTGGTLTANSINITGSTNTINAGGGADVFSGTTSGWLLTSNLNELTDNIFTFTDVTGADLSGESLTGTTGTDTFDMTGVSLTANGIAVSGVQNNQVNANGGADVFTGAANGWSLTGTANELTDSIDEAYTFTGVTDANLSGQALTGSAGADTFDMTGASLTANGIAVSGVQNNHVNANGGADVFTGTANGWSLTGSANELTDSIDETYTFTGVTDANLSGQALTGSAGADTFDMTGASLTANGIAVSGVQNNQVNANGGADVFTGAANGWSLTGTANELTDSIDQTYTFTGVTDANISGQTLTGTANADTFDITGTNELTVSNIDFTSVAAVNAGDGADQVNTDGADASLFAELGSAVDYGLETLGITFRETENADLNGGTLAGGSEADSFEVTGTALTANEINITNAASAINAGNGGDSVIVNDANSTLTGGDNALNTANYQFTSIESADLTTNDLTGTADADTFDVTGANALTSADIDFTNVASVDAGNGVDRVNTNGATLTSETGTAVDNALTTQQIAFTSVENLDLANGTLAGSGAADSFEVTGSALTANAINVTNAASGINAGDGVDSLTVYDTNSTLTGTDNELDTANYEFSSVETVDLADNALTGTANADTFDVTGANALTSASIDFSNVAAVNADDGADQVNTDGADASLFAELGNAVDYALETLGITFRETENADLNGGTLAGSSEADSFEVTSTALTANEINITNAASAVDAGTGNDAVTVNDANSTLTGTNNALNTANYQFTSIDSADLTANALTGTADADTFDVTGANALSSADIDFTNVASVDAGNGDDQVNTNGATLTSETGTAVDNALTTQQVAFVSVENLDLANGTLTGSDAADTFEVAGSALTANAINVTNAASGINAGNGDDVVTVNDATSTLTGTDNELDTANYEFSSVETVDLADNALTGTANADTFDVTGANALTSAGIDFTNVEVVNGDDGADQVNTDGADASLFAELGNAVDYALETLGITFRETENADLNGGTLAGSSEADSFEVTGTALTANEINITNAASAINAGNGDDSVVVNDANSTLTGTDNALNTANYQFTSIENADLTTNALTGTADADTFDVTGANALTSANIDFTNVASVDASDGDDQVNTNGATLTSETGTAVDNALTTQQVAFVSVENLDLNGGALAGSSEADSFEVTGSALTANAISVTNAASAINAGNGGDSVIVNDANSTLTGSDNALNTANYQFASIESADLTTNALTGTSGADTFDVTSANALTSAGIDFTNVASVDADDGDDQVNTNGATLTSETGTAVDNALTTQQIAFTAVENLDLAGGTLAGSDAADSFEATGSALTANGISVTNAASAINAGDGVDSLTVNDANSTLTGADNALDTANYQFTSVETADLAGNALTGTAGDDIFDVSAPNALTSADIDFTNVASVDAGNGDDQVNTNAATLVSETDVAGTVAVNNALTTQQIAFTSVENLDLANGALAGSDAADSFEVTEAALTANAISVTNASSAINAGDGSDTLTVNDANSTLTGTDNELDTANYEFSSVETVNLADNALTGTSGADTFDVTGANALTSAGINFSNVSAVNADDGADQVNTDGADASLFAELGNAVDYALETLGITFRATENADLNGGTLAGSSEADSFEVTGAALTANAITVTNAASAINAGNGDDTVTVNDTNSTLTGGDNALNTANYQFTSIETADLQSNVLTGTAGADTFDVTGANALTSVDIDFTNVASVDAGNGDDQVNTNGATLASESGSAVDNALTTQQIAFTSVENLDLANGTLTGSDAADSFDVTGATLTANAINVTNAASAINAGNGTDALTVNDANSTLTGADNALDTASYEFTSVETADLQGNALTGTSGADTFDVTGSNALTSAGINFTDLASVDAVGGNDQVNTDGATLVSDTGSASDNALETQGIAFTNVDSVDLANGALTATDAAETFNTGATSGQVEVNDMTITSVATIDAGDGNDSLVAANDAVVALNGTELGLIASDIVFSNLEAAGLSSGTLNGTAANDEFALVGANQFFSNGILFSDVANVDGGTGTDSITTSAATSAELTVTDNALVAQSIRFDAIESADLSGGTLNDVAAQTEIFTLGDESASVSTKEILFTSVSQISAGTDDQIQGSTGDDTFTIRSDEQVAANDILFDGPLTLLGSDGNDTLVNEIDGVRWLINAVGNGINQVGKFTFSQFESLFNNVGALDLATSMQADFNGESVSFGDSTMTLNFDGSENVELLSTYGSGVSVQAEGDPIAITGSVTADELLILSYGDIELRTDVNLISIQTLNGQSIDVTMIQNGDLVIRSIDIEGGTLVLDSLVAGTGSLTSETINTTDVSALNAYIGTGESGVEGAGEWASIGETNNQLTFEVALRLDLEAITFVSPFFPNGAPLVYNTEGTETDSLISSQSPALVIVDSVGDVSQLNPAVFEALSPFIADANAVAGSSGYYASSDVPSTLDTELLASLLASYEPTASGSPEGYQVGDEEEDEDAQVSGSGINTDQEIRIAYSDTGEVLGVVQNYVFKAGDSLWKLSERFLGTGYAWNSIMEQNPEIESPSSIKNGTVIRVIKSVSDEVAQAIQNALDSGLGVKKGNTVTFPVDARSQLNM